MAAVLAAASHQILVSPAAAIIGGTSAESYSFMASLKTDTKNDGVWKHEHDCGAVLVAPKWVVTAAHCVKPSPGVVLKPEQVRLVIGNKDNTAGEFRDVSKIIPHSGFSGSGNSSYDIAMLELSTPSSKTPIGMAPFSVGEGWQVRLLGWGATCADAQQCMKSIRYLRELDTLVTRDSNCTAGNFSGNTEICILADQYEMPYYADSGGPALFWVNGAWTLAGLTSRISSNALDSDIIYTDATAFQSWIDGVINGEGGGGDPGGTAARYEPAMVYDRGETMTVHRWFSNGTSFGRLTDYNSGTFRLSRVGNRVAGGDVDGDGDDDIVMAYQNPVEPPTFTFHVWKNGATYAGEWWTSGSFDLGRVAGRMVLGDFNGDGKDEPAMVYDDGDGTMSIYRWLSNGTAFTHTTDYHSSGSFGLDRVGDRAGAGDVDGDGDDDIVMAYQNYDNTFTYHVYKQGYTYAGAWYVSGSFGLDRVGSRMLLGDFNGDGKAEPALVYDSNDNRFTTFRWLSDGTEFRRTTDYQSGAFNLAEVQGRIASGDVDGDGKDDIVMASQNGSIADLHVFKAGGTVWAGVWASTGTYDLTNAGDRIVVGRW